MRQFVLRSAMRCSHRSIDFTSFSTSSIRTFSKIENITNVKIYPMTNSKYAKPMTLEYIQEGRKKSRNLIEVCDSVIVIIYNVTRKVLVCVKQFRPGVYYNNILPEDRKENVDIEKYPPKLGITIEFCTGSVNKNEPLKNIAKTEVLEECGYDVDLNNFQNVSAYRFGVGLVGTLQTCYYCEVTDKMRVTKGGGVGDEVIEVLEWTIPEVKEFISKPIVAAPVSFMFGVLWFLANKST